MPENSPAPRCDFDELIDNIGHGTLRDRLETQLGAVAQAVREPGTAGNLALTFTLKPDGEFASVSADVKITKPGHSIPPSAFFWSDETGLARSNPRQLNLRDIDRSKPDDDDGPLRAV